MANQRMYIRCVGCGDELYIGKRMAVGYYTTEPMREKLQSINDWYDKHQHCKHMPDNFEISYEIDREHYRGGIRE